MLRLSTCLCLAMSGCRWYVKGWDYTMLRQAARRKGADIMQLTLPGRVGTGLSAPTL